MVAIEAFNKYLVVVPLPDKKPETVALALLQHVLSRFAAPGQVVSDNGTELTQGAFKQLLSDCFDHNLTSVCHPRANGQAEKAVHIVKQALSTMAVQKHAADDWDSDVAFLMLGYNCSPHSSTGYNPCQLMHHVRQPIAPPAIRTGMARPIDFEDASATDNVQPPANVNLPLLSPDQIERMMLADPAERVTTFACVAESVLPAAISLRDLNMLFRIADFSQVAVIGHLGPVPEQL
jgi:hypothetical protein